MGLANTSKMISEPSQDCSAGLNLETRLHKYSGLVYRENVGESDTGQAFECDGLDLCVYGEDENDIEILDAVTCDCSDNFSGFYRVRDSSGAIKQAYERAPRTWCVESNGSSSAGDGPPGGSGDVVLIRGLNLDIKSKCTPLNVRLWLDVCGWRYFPTDPEIVQDFIEYTVTEIDADDTEKQVYKKRCTTGGSDKRLGCFDIPAKTTLRIDLEGGYQYFGTVNDTFKSNIGEVKIVADVFEQVSRRSLNEDGDC